MIIKPYLSVHRGESNLGKWLGKYAYIICYPDNTKYYYAIVNLGINKFFSFNDVKEYLNGNKTLS